MLVPLSKTDVLQSIGFALTSANEELARVKDGLHEGIMRAVMDGRVIGKHEQGVAHKHYKDAVDKVNKLELMKRMAEFGKDDEPCLLSTDEFELIECNLPAR